MTRLRKLIQLRKELLQLPASQREAILKRATLKKVDGFMKKPQQFRDDIICNLSEPVYAQKHPAGALPPHDEYDRPKSVPPRKGKETPETPVNNFPATNYDGGGVPDAVTLEIFALRRRNAELSAKVETLNNKQSRVLECLQSLRRFFRLWIYEGQGESYDSITARMKRIDAMIDLIEDRSVGPAPAVEIPERWRKQ